MVMTEKQKAYNNKYKKERTKQVAIRFFPSDMNVYDHIKSQDNIAQYIKGLVRADMEKGGQ